jgi:hypothetical protein
VPHKDKLPVAVAEDIAVIDFAIGKAVVDATSD